MRAFFSSAVVRSTLLLALAGIVSLAVMAFSRPFTPSGVLPDLAAGIPSRFGGWTERDLSAVVLPAEIDEEEGTVTLYRAYTNEEGAMVTLVIAYGAARGDTVRLHQPKVCYKAQGFEILSHRMVDSTSLPLARMVASRNPGREHVTYWMRTGDRVTGNQASQQWANIRAGLGRAADSTLVRISTNTVREDQVWDIQERFIEDLLNDVSPEIHELLTARRGDST